MPTEAFITVAPKGPINASNAWVEAELALLLALFAPRKSVAGEAPSTPPLFDCVDQLSWFCCQNEFAWMSKDIEPISRPR
jgi:hypothetical protein